LPGESVSWDLSVTTSATLRWSIRVRGRSTGVLRNWDATTYWDGEFTIPLADVEWR
jgi:hypothetical protein